MAGSTPQEQGKNPRVGRNGKEPPAEYRFKPGQSGNPGGKAVGTRNALNAAFLKRMAEEFEKNGEQVIKAVAKHKPDVFVRVLAGFVPKEIEVTNGLQEHTDDQLAAALVTIRAILDAQGHRAGTGAPEAAKPAETVPAVSKAG